MRTLEIYGRPGCMPCQHAKDLARNKGYRSLFFDVTAPVHRTAMLKRVPDAKTVPQIFAGDIYIGGFDELKRREGDGTLSRMLGSKETI